MLEHSQLNLFESEQDLKPSIVYRGASLAKTYRSPEIKQESRESDLDYGLNLQESLARYDQSTRSWKTSQICLQENMDFGLAEFSGTWPRSGMMRNGIAYRLRTLVRRTSGSESGFLPTPQASDGTFLKIKRPMMLRGNAYRICSNQGIDGNAKLADIAWNVWGGPLNPEYAEACMMYPIKWTDCTPSETP